MLPISLEIIFRPVALALGLLIAVSGATGETVYARILEVTVAPEHAVLASFTERVSEGALDGLSIAHRLTDEAATAVELRISGDGRTSVSAEGGREVQGLEIGGDELRALFESLAAGVATLTPRSSARFLPDSAVGSVTVTVDGQEAEFFYLTDDDQRTSQAQPLSDEMSAALQKLETLRVQAESR